jgi:hypothetical protein
MVIYAVLTSYFHIRPQTEENWASRPLCHTQASDRQISSWVGDHQRIPAVVCFLIFDILGVSKRELWGNGLGCG